MFICKDTNEPPIILISNVYYIFNVYNRYYYKGKKGFRENEIAFKDCFDFFNRRFRFTIRTVMMFCC